MRFRETSLAGAYVVELEQRGDARGFFARLFCADEMAAQGLEPRVAQINNSVSAEAGTLRGLHYQVAPAAETKLVRCVHGALWDVAIDLRSDSESFGRWFGVELSAENRVMMYVPRGFAHGFVTLEPDTEVLYVVSYPYSPEHERGVRWDDPAFGIEWPVAPAVISDKDRSHPAFDPAFHVP
jgi:dTDP-4-dehydrorhamnose 3,5-epimerase